MTQELIQEFMKRLDAVGGAAANGGKYAFEQLVRVERIESIVALAGSVTLGTLVAMGCLLAARYNHRRSISEDLPDCDHCGWDKGDARLARNECYVGCGSVVFIALMVVVANIPGIVAPEAVVLRSLINKCMSK